MLTVRRRAHHCHRSVDLVIPPSLPRLFLLQQEERVFGRAGQQLGSEVCMSRGFLPVLLSMVLVGLSLNHDTHPRQPSGRVDGAHSHCRDAVNSSRKRRFCGSMVVSDVAGRHLASHLQATWPQLRTEIPAHLGWLRFRGLVPPYGHAERRQVTPTKRWMLSIENLPQGVAAILVKQY